MAVHLVHSVHTITTPIAAPQRADPSDPSLVFKKGRAAVHEQHGSGYSVRGI